MAGMSSHLKELWEEWELRTLVLLSLAIQVLLIILGHHRKYRPNVWLKALVWTCYMAADAVAIYALGKIATWLKQMRRDGSDTAKGLPPDAQMTAFWAPFLLLHLGGPDTITAYSLEDNDLWSRHLVRLVIQTVVTLFIFFQALTGSDLWGVSLLMIVSGLIKYGEKVYVLRAASSEHFRDSIPDTPRDYSQILDEYKLKKAEGYDITMHKVIEVHGVNTEHNSNVDPDLSSHDEKLLSDKLKKRKHKQDGEKSNCGNESEKREQGRGKGKCSQSLLAAARGTSDFFRRLCGDKELLPEGMSKRNWAELAVAKDLINIFQRLFADLVLSFQDRDTSLSILKDKHFHVVFRVIEIELGLMYDLLYTKAMAVHKGWGFFLRTVSILSTGMALVLFSLSDKGKYKRPNIDVTFLLLWMAIFLEIYALFALLVSDKAACWLKDHGHTSILDRVERLQPLYNRRRWSGSIAQYNLLSFALKEKHLPCHRILEWLHVDEKVVKYLYRRDKKVSDFLKERVIEHLKSQKTSDFLKAQVIEQFESQETSENEFQIKWTYRGHIILEREKLLDNFKWSIELEFDQSIIVWHIATELLCPENEETLTEAAKISVHLSRYMLHLLVMYPFLMPIGVGRVEFRDTYADAMSILNEQEHTNALETPPAEKVFVKYLHKCQKLCNSQNKKESKMASARTKLRNVNTEVGPIMPNGEKSKFNLYHGCQLASQLSNIDEVKKWNIISFVWVEMLAYAAVKCKGVQHARQLRRGGEFLTHVWFLMAHFGLTDHFQIPHAPAIAELLVKQK